MQNQSYDRVQQPVMSSILSVVRIGPVENVDNIAASLLRNALIDFFSEKNDENKSQTTNHNMLSISNKYFTANVILKDLGGVSDGNESLSSSSPRPHNEDGIILVFDNAVKSNSDQLQSPFVSFDSLDSVHDKAVDAGCAGDLMRLCVGATFKETSNDGLKCGKEYEQEYSRRVSWCLDRGYEYVEADLTPGGLKKGHSDRDKDGFARIAEAVAGTVWTSAVMGNQKKKQLLNLYDSDKAETEETAKTEEIKSSDCDYEPPTPPPLEAAISAVDTAEDAAREEKARQALLEQIAKEEDHCDDENTTKKEEEQRKFQKELVEERVFNQLDGAIKQVKNIREMSQTGSMSDDERRKRAGDAAMLLMDIMGQLDCDDDEEDDSSDYDEGGQNKEDTQEQVAA